MKIRKIGFAEYKAFSKTSSESGLHELELAPITVVFGKNNSGKSAVVRLPMLLLGAIESENNSLPSEVRGLSFGAGFLDMVHGGDFFGRPKFVFCASENDRALDFEATLFNRGAFSADEPPEIWSYEMSSPVLIKVNEPTGRGLGEANFSGLLPNIDQSKYWRSAATKILNEMVHLGPIRASVPQAYSNEAFSRIERNGANAAQLLRLESRVAEMVSTWYEKNMDGWRLSLQRVGDGFGLHVSRSAKLSTNLSQGGEGLQQVLPVVIHQMWRQFTGGEFLDVVEQPELHLHAGAQPPLADLFIQTAIRCSGTTLVETNSEGLLLRLQRRVAEGVIGADKIALYFVQSNGESAELQRIKMSSNGELDWWPEGVFEENFDEVAAIRRAQRRSS